VHSSQDTRAQIELLDTLSGVAVPRASALLAIWQPDQFAVIDDYMVVLLQKYGLMQGANSRNITCSDYLLFLDTLREMAERIASTQISLRQIELSLYQSCLLDRFQENASLYY
jgi:thermostable 8-oxoguanine DNA glycosylase